MAIKERKEREKQDMRNMIIESATQLFLKQGYDKTSIRSIAEDIEYSPATIYLYFKDKDEIFYVIHENAFTLLEKVFRKHDTITDPFEKLTAICKSYIDFALRNPDYYDLMFIMRAPLSQIACADHWKEGSSAFEYLLTTISDCVDQKLIHSDNKFLLAMSVWSFGHGLVSLYVRGRFGVMKISDEIVTEMLDNAIDLFLNNLKT